MRQNSMMTLSELQILVNYYMLVGTCLIDGRKSFSFVLRDSADIAQLRNPLYGYKRGNLISWARAFIILRII